LFSSIFCEFIKRYIPFYGSKTPVNIELILLQMYLFYKNVPFYKNIENIADVDFQKLN